jgi:Tol biopolymer transport system component
LAYYSGRSGNDDIWVVNMDGTGELQVTRDSASDRRPAWNPDGTKLVFDSDRAGSRDIWVANADGSDLQQLTNTPGEELFASWSPDGSEIVFFAYAEGHNEIWAVSPDGSNLRPLTDNLADERQGQCTFACHQPSWSPDGARLAFHADQDGKRDIWIMDADGSNARQLTSGTVNNFLPSFTSDGKIIFIAEIASLQRTLVDIKTIDPDGGEETTLFEQVAHGGPFIWSPDGNRVALHSQRAAAGNFDIFVATLGDAPQIEIPAVAEEPAPDEAVDQGSEPSTASEAPLDEAPERGEAASPAPARVPLRLAGVVAIIAGLVFLVALVAGAVVFFVARSRRQ